ncbi:MAG: alpha/beta fold hydrolase [Gemmatimonadales bacterium]|nr:MAG: alpha/beta fold hydrolase [Gemmatimonadales bacterium]
MTPGTKGARTLPLQVERFHEVDLPSGVHLPGVEQAFTLLGTPRADGSNVVLAFHSLTGLPDPRSWWPGLVGEDRLLDTGDWALLSPALLGACHGTRVVGLEGPLPPPPGLGIRDQAHLVGHLLDRLGLERVHLAVGGSLGGMVALEWAASFPERAGTVLSVAAPARQPAHALAFNHLQREALELGGPGAGLGLARKIAMLTYRTAGELDTRFGRDRREDGLWQVASWLDHHGRKLEERFQAASYRALIGAMDRHDVGAGRPGGIAGALRAFQGRLVGVGIPGDLLYPDELVREWVEAAGADYRRIDSIHGHDAFLLEEAQMAAILADALGHPRAPGGGA